MSISSPIKAGSNISSKSNIKFSALRKYFLKMKPRTTFSGSETFDAETGSVSASQLLRRTSFSRDSDVDEFSEIDQKLPFVPDCTENVNISFSTNWKTSQFVGSIKYYYIQQSTAVSPTNDDLNLSITDQNWNNNLFSTIRKWFFIDGTIGSNDSNLAACSLGKTTGLYSFMPTHNLNIIISGNVYGASGRGETSSLSPTNGGDALEIETFGGLNVYINLSNDAKVYAGGGGGPRGGNGGNGGQGGATYLIYGMSGVSCTQIQTQNGPSGAGGVGQPGGTGRGYSNISGSLSSQIQMGGNPLRNLRLGSSGTKSSRNASAAGWSTIYSGKGGDGGDGGFGGNGGDWAQPGDSTGATGGERGVNGDRGTGGHRADVGPCASSGCFSCGTPGTGTGSPGKPGKTASTESTVGGKAIRTIYTNSYILLNENVNNLKGGRGA